MRRSKRIASCVAVTWRRRGGDVGAVGTDINADGMFLRTDELAVEPGTLMELRLQLPDRELLLLATARFVGRTQAGNGIGVEFYMMPSHARLSWLNYYDALLDAETPLEDEAAPQELAAKAQG